MQSAAIHSHKNPEADVKKALLALRKAPFCVAAPSFVVPDTVSGNAHFLAPYFQEIAILLFQTKACLDYDTTDLSPRLAQLDVKWHVHLPLDLEWGQGPQKDIHQAWQAIHGLVKKVDYLKPVSYVLHPPSSPEQLRPLAARFKSVGIAPCCVLLENVEETDLARYYETALQEGFRFCLDLGHVLAYNQDHLLALPQIWEHVDMLHVCAPGHQGRHESLAQLSAAGKNMLQEWLRLWLQNQNRQRRRCMTLEIFNEQKLWESALLLAEWLEDWKVST